MAAHAVLRGRRCLDSGAVMTAVALEALHEREARRGARRCRSKERRQHHQTEIAPIPRPHFASILDAKMCPSTVIIDGRQQKGGVSSMHQRRAVVIAAALAASALLAARPAQAC